MAVLSDSDLQNARTALLSLIHKCEKAAETLKIAQSSRKAQLSLLENRVKALRIAIELIERELRQ